MVVERSRCSPPAQRVTFEAPSWSGSTCPARASSSTRWPTSASSTRTRRAARNARATTQLLDELLAIAVPRGGGLAWEYYFTFDGGRPPWVSASRRAPALQAIARAAVKLGRMPELLPRIQRGPDAVRAAAADRRARRDRRGRALRCSTRSGPSLRILNGFVQSLVGLYDVAQITGDPRAAQLFADGDRAARVEVPRFDTGAWSLYSRGAITRESDLHYHTLLRDFLASLCDRTAEPVYCTAESHFTSYLTTPPELELRTQRAARRHARRRCASRCRRSRA